MQRPAKNILGLFLLMVATVSAASKDPAIEPPRVLDHPVWRFPLEPARESIFQGHTRVLVSISEEGQLLDFIVLGFTHPAFAQEVATALPQFRFSPARIRGEPATTRIPITFHFEQQGNVVSMTASDQMEQHFARLTRNNDFKPTVCPGVQLDQPLIPATLVSPEYPSEMRSRGETAVVTVDFYVDPEGRVRMPATSAASHPSFARTAIGAVEQWRFDPPTSGGEPVLVHVQQQFIFHPPADPKSKSAAIERATATTETAQVRPRF